MFIITIEGREDKGAYAVEDEDGDEVVEEGEGVVKEEARGGCDIKIINI